MERGVVFCLEDREFALPLEAAGRALRAVAITRLPEALPGVAGVIDVHGEIVPVIDLRERFGLPVRPLAPDAQFLLVSAGSRCLALWVDRVQGVAEWAPGDYAPAEPLLPGIRVLRGIARGGGGLVLVHDLEALLRDTADVLSGGVLADA